MKILTIRVCWQDRNEGNISFATVILDIGLIKRENGWRSEVDPSIQKIRNLLSRKIEMHYPDKTVHEVISWSNYEQNTHHIINLPKDHDSAGHINSTIRTIS